MAFSFEKAIDVCGIGVVICLHFPMNYHTVPNWHKFLFPAAGQMDTR